MDLVLPAGPWTVRVQVLGPTPEGTELPELRTVEVRGGEEALAEFRP